jgi:succinyl-diaminopimelate desuccinylase
MTTSPDAVAILQELIRCPSVTPAEAGVLDYMEGLMNPAGFTCTRMPFSEEGTADVDNLFVRIGTSGPHFCFAGHVDVVPPGADSLWTYPPFAAEVHDGIIYGRGACDMKGSVAAFCAAAMGFAKDHDGKLPGSISLLITGDEEGIAINGTVKMLAELRRRGEVPDVCLVGEPTCPEVFGDTIKIGRRGSIHFEITWQGVQGHSAYPHKAVNPVTPLARLIDRVASHELDKGNAHFGPSTLAVTNFDTGNPANNVIPASANARFNIRYNTEHTAASLKDWVERECETVKQQMGGSYSIAIVEGADAFMTQPGSFVSIIANAVEAETGVKPKLDTGGGTSDARFIKDYCPVAEFGLVGATMHKVDEQVALGDLRALSDIYLRVLEGYFPV